MTTKRRPHYNNTGCLKKHQPLKAPSNCKHQISQNVAYLKSTLRKQSKARTIFPIQYILNNNYGQDDISTGFPFWPWKPFIKFLPMVDWRFHLPDSLLKLMFSILWDKNWRLSTFPNLFKPYMVPFAECGSSRMVHLPLDWQFAIDCKNSFQSKLSDWGTTCNIEWPGLAPLNFYSFGAKWTVMCTERAHFFHFMIFRTGSCFLCKHNVEHEWFGTLCQQWLPEYKLHPESRQPCGGESSQIIFC